MSPIGDRNGGWNGAAHNALVRWRAFEKASATSGLRSDAGEEPPPREEYAQGQAREKLRRSGTDGFVPERHAPEMESPRLTSAFVAQLLGQLLPDGEFCRLQARSAYGLDDARSALLIDTRL